MDHRNGLSSAIPHLKAWYSSFSVYSLLKKCTASVSLPRNLWGATTTVCSPSLHRTHIPLPVTTGTAGASNSAVSRMN